MNTLDFCLPKSERILKRREYLHIQSRGRKLSSPSFLVFGLVASPSDDAGPPRIGITVSRRVGGAVVRNRVKRLVREAFRHDKQQFPRGLTMVVVAKAAAAALQLAQVVQELKDIQRKLTVSRSGG